MYKAFAYLYNHNHAQCVQQFTSICDLIEKNMSDNEKEKVGPDYKYYFLPLFYDRWFTLKETSNMFDAPNWIGQIYIKSLLGHAYSLIERDTGFELANNLIEQSRIAYNEYEEYSHTLSNDDSDKAKVIKSGLKVLQAEIDDRAGWYCYKKYPQDLIEAEKCLIAATSVDPNPEYHLHLGYIYSALGEKNADTIEKKRYVSLARAHCEHASEMAGNSAFACKVDVLQKMIDKTEKSN